ncbi:MAG: polyhydroxyalkanoic acid system family protein [Chitinophagaceae bacterium]
MSSLSLTIPHELPKEEALTRIKGLLQSLRAEHANMISDVKEEWTGDEGKFAFSAKGFDLSGLINVSGTAVGIDAKLPFALSLFSGSIKNIITEKAKALLAK